MKENTKQFYYEHQPEAANIEKTGKLVVVGRNELNPLPGFTFVSIAYYLLDGEYFGIVF